MTNETRERGVDDRKRCERSKVERHRAVSTGERTSTNKGGEILRNESAHGRAAAHCASTCRVGASVHPSSDSTPPLLRPRCLPRPLVVCAWCRPLGESSPVRPARTRTQSHASHHQRTTPRPTNGSRSTPARGGGREGDTCRWRLGAVPLFGVRPLPVVRATPPPTSHAPLPASEGRRLAARAGSIAHARANWLWRSLSRTRRILLLLLLRPRADSPRLAFHDRCRVKSRPPPARPSGASFRRPDQHTAPCRRQMRRLPPPPPLPLLLPLLLRRRRARRTSRRRRRPARV